MKATLHDLLVRDLVYQVTNFNTMQGNYLCVPEVQIKGVRFDAVSVHLVDRTVTAFEVKSRRADAQGWLRAERWKAAVDAGALPVLAFPEGIEDAGDLATPREVKRLRKLRNGSWEPFRFYAGGKNFGTPELLVAVMSAVRREAFWSGFIGTLGEPIAEALRRLEEEAA